MCIKLKKNICFFFFPVVLSFLLSGCSESETPAKENNSKPDMLPYSEKSSELNDEDKKGNFIVEARNATVTIETDFGLGSGFFVNSDCLILTNKHVVTFDETKLKHIEDEIEELDSSLMNIKAIIDKKDNTFSSQCDDCSLDARKKNIKKETEMYANLEETISESRDKVYQLQYNLNYIIKLSDKSVHDGELIKVSDDYDLALLKIDKEDCQFIEKGDDTVLNPGDKIVAIGNPSGYSHSVTSGVFSRIEGEGNDRAIQIDASVNPGNSGGPIVDKNGLVVGVVTTKRMDLEGIGFAIPISVAFKELGDFLQ